MLAVGSSGSHYAEKQRQRPIDPQEQGIIRLADHLTNLIDGDDRDLVYGNLRAAAQSILGRGLDLKAKLIGVGTDRRCERTDDD
jgi:hypothetical protein